MKRFIPSSVELAIFATMAILSAAFVGEMKDASHDLVMSMLACPIFVAAAVLGLRRSPVWMREAEAETEIVVNSSDEADLA